MSLNIAAEDSTMPLANQYTAAFNNKDNRKFPSATKSSPIFHYSKNLMDLSLTRLVVTVFEIYVTVFLNNCSFIYI